MTPIERITERVNRAGNPDDPDTPRPLLTVHEFFDGNTVVGSIGCNLPGEPRPEDIGSLLQKIAERTDVADIRVSITAFDDPEWPFSDTVHIMMTATPEAVAGWFPEELAPDEVWEDQDFANSAHEPYSVPAQCRVVTCWWD